jgi:hypothetical protein
VNLPIVLYIIVNLYVTCKYTRESLYKGYNKSKHRIDQILSIHRLYFAFWTIFQLSNLAFGFMQEKSKILIATHSIFISLTPLNICIAFCKAIYYSRVDNSYQMIDIEDEDDGDQQRGQTLLDSMILSNPPPGMENKVKHQRNPSGNSQTMEHVKKHWDNDTNSKNIMRREILEYIVRGFDEIYKDAKPTDSMDKFEIDDPNVKAEKPPLFRRLVLFCLGKEDANVENYEDYGNKSALLGHPDILKKVSVLTESQIERETQIEKSIMVKRQPQQFGRTLSTPKLHKEDEYEFVELAPKIFSNIRKIQNIDDHVIKSIFSSENMKDLDISISSGKGGSFFIKPVNGGRMLMKSITKPEYEIIQGFLNDYYCYLLMNPNTYLNPILGVYKMKLQKSSQVPPISFILMRNVLNIDPSDLKEEDKIY